MIRLRFFYQKKGNIKYTGTLDMQKIWERSCRRAGLPIAYSQGFHPQARIQQATPLPLGIEGLAEMVDIWFTLDSVPINLFERINQALPSGIAVNSCMEVDLKENSIQNRINTSVYLIYDLPFGKNQLENKISELMSKHEILYERRGQTINLRERIINLGLLEIDNEIALRMNLKQLPSLTGRPEDVLNMLGVEPNKSRIVREKLLFS
jgi:radical SAM-linked protein